MPPKSEPKPEKRPPTLSHIPIRHLLTKGLGRQPGVTATGKDVQPSPEKETSEQGTQRELSRESHPDQNATRTASAQDAPLTQESGDTVNIRDCQRQAPKRPAIEERTVDRSEGSPGGLGSHAAEAAGSTPANPYAPSTPIATLKKKKLRGKNDRTATREASRQEQELEPPLMATVPFTRNNLTMREVEYMGAITTAHGGYSRFDNVAPNCRFLYRCPLTDCPSLHPGKGLPINSNGLHAKLRRRILRSHQKIEQDIQFQAKVRDGSKRNFPPPRPKKTDAP